MNPNNAFNNFLNFHTIQKPKKMFICFTHVKQINAVEISLSKLPKKSTIMEIEKRLDKDYYKFISLTHDYYTKITDENIKNLCEKWLIKILGQRVNGVREKRNRNTFMMHLLMQMNSSELTGIFTSPPETGNLPSSKRVFDDISDEDTDEKVGRTEAVIDDIKENYDDECGNARTYVAIRHLPENDGMYGFISLTLDKEDSDDYHINPCTVDKSKLKHARALRRLQSGSIFSCVQPSEREMEDFYLNNVEQKISGDVSTMFKDLAATSEPQCWKTENSSFFTELLQQIDREITGTVDNNDVHKLVSFLVNRLTDDLRKEPKMRHIMELPAEQRQLRVLEILRQKLILRRQEKKQRMLLTKMEERMNRDFGCSCKEDEQSNFMWELAVTRPIKDTEMIKLEKVYPSNIIPAFLELLSNDRQVILENGLKRQQDLLESMRIEVYRDVQENKIAYNKARSSYRNWNEILSTVEEMMFDAGTEDLDNEEGSLENSENLLKDMMAQTKEIESLIINEARRAEDLISQIADVNSWTFSTSGSRSKDWSWEMKAEIEKFKCSIEQYESLIAKQKKRIQDLESELSSKRRK